MRLFKQKKKVNISQGSIQYRGMSIPCEYKLDISEQLLNILEPCDGYWDNAPEDMQEKVFNVYTHFFSYIPNPTYLQKIQ